tara:strand:- start:4628 stop:4879 length:252 start_codon:yes stop_codon:yes gene_type:complete
LAEKKKSAKKTIKKPTSKKTIKKSTAKKVTKKTSKKTKKSKNSEPSDTGIIIVDDDLTIDREAEMEERRAYLEEARSQEASSD